MLHIAETFESIQGEGTWAGTPMLFVRLAGCNVGRVLIDTKAPQPPPGLIVLNEDDMTALRCKTHTICRSALGQEFVCDTNYAPVMQIPDAEAVNLINSSAFTHICITGGEPMLQQVAFATAIRHTILSDDMRLRMYHLETSGTIPWVPQIEAMAEGWWQGDGARLWVTCSPKAGFRPAFRRWVNEWKFVYHAVDMAPRDFIDQVEETVGDHGGTVFVQPINSIEAPAKVYVQAVERWLDILRQRPHWRLGVQLHKFLNMR